MEQSILKSTKKVLGIAPDYNEFDEDILTHINSVFTTLLQLGVGPVEGFAIEDESAVWADFLGSTSDPKYNNVKSYMHLRVKRLFDPPQTSYHMLAQKEQIEELEYRLNAQHEADTWVPPTPPPPDEEVMGVWA